MGSLQHGNEDFEGALRRLRLEVGIDEQAAPRRWSYTSQFASTLIAHRTRRAHELCCQGCAPAGHGANAIRLRPWRRQLRSGADRTQNSWRCPVSLRRYYRRHQRGAEVGKCKHRTRHDCAAMRRGFLMVRRGLVSTRHTFASAQQCCARVSAVRRMFGGLRRRAGITCGRTRAPQSAGRETQVQRQQAQKQGRDVSFHDWNVVVRWALVGVPNCFRHHARVGQDFPFGVFVGTGGALFSVSN